MELLAYWIQPFQILVLSFWGHFNHVSERVINEESNRGYLDSSVKPGLKEVNLDFTDELDLQEILTALQTPTQSADFSILRYWDVFLTQCEDKKTALFLMKLLRVSQ